MDKQVATAVSALEFPFLHTRNLFDRGSRNLLTSAYDEPKLAQLDFASPPAAIHCFWSASPLNALVLLGLRSFVHHGHAVSLYTYDPPDELARHLPSGVAVRLAEEVVPRPIYDEFRTRLDAPGFSELFRYAALYAAGGWWVDPDVVLTRRLPAVRNHFFCSQWSGVESGHLLTDTVLHAPKACRHMLHLYRSALAALRQGIGDGASRDIGQNVLTEHVLLRAPELKRHVFSPTLFNTIDRLETDLLCTANRDAAELVSDPRVIGISLWNRSWTEAGLQLGRAEPASIAGLLSAHYASPNRLTTLAALHSSDKGAAYRGTTGHHYTRTYRSLLEPLMLRPVRIMEIGLCRGLLEGSPQADVPSLRMWLDFFPNATVFGVDISDFSWFANDRARIFRADQSSEESLRERVVKELDGTALDIVLDDGSHVGWDQQITFKQLFPLVAAGGLYVIEDLDIDPPEASSRPQTPTTKAMLEHFVSAGRLLSAAWSREQSELLASQIDLVEFYDSDCMLHFHGLHGGLAVIRKKR